MRLVKFLAEAGVAARRQAGELVKAGRVKVGGRVVKEPGLQVDPETASVEVDGRRLSVPRGKVCYLVFKPRGYVSTVRDPQGRPKVVDLVPDRGRRLYPVGRLDMDTEGLLLLTDDGELAYLLTHPKFGVPKTYRALVAGFPAPAALDRLRRGIILEDGPTAPAQVEVVRQQGRHTWLEVTIHEGRKRQVRRMLEAIGYPVTALRRTSLGFLTLDGLRPGQYRRLTSEEIARLKDLAAGYDRAGT